MERKEKKMAGLLDHLEILGNPYKSEHIEPLAVDEYINQTTRYVNRLHGPWDKNEWLK